MKATFFSLILFIFSASLFAQESIAVVQDTVFYCVYGGANQELARDFIETSDKGFMICGASSSFGQGASSVYVAKTDSMGHYLWGKTYGGINADRGMSITSTPDNGAFIAGYSNSFNNFDYDGYWLKIDSAGTLEWQKTYAGNDWDFIYDVALAPDSGMIMAGETYSNSAGDADAWIIRTDKNGDTLWTVKYGTPYNEKFNSVVVFDNKIFSCGKIADPSSNLTKAFVVCYSLDGTLLNANSFIVNPNCNHELKSIQTTQNGNLLLAGGMIDPAQTIAQKDMRMRIDTSFSVIWVDSAYAYQETKICNHLFEDNRQHLIATFTINGGLGKTAMFLGDYDAGNQYKFGSTYGGIEEEEGLKGMITSRNTLAFLGNTQGFQPYYTFGDWDYWLVLFKADTLIPDHKIKYYAHSDTIGLSPLSLKNLQEEGITLFPNPVQSNHVVYLKQAQVNFTNLELVDISGRICWQGMASTKTTEIPLQSVSSGLYFLRISGASGTRTIKLSVTD